MTRHWWRFMVTLALVPVVMLANPATAEAASPNHTDWVGAQWDINGIGVGDIAVHAAECGGSFAMVKDSLGQINVKTSGGYCISGVDLSPWSCQIFEGGDDPCTDYRITFEGSGDCDLVQLNPGTNSYDKDGFVNVASSWGSDSATAGNCDPTQVCLEAAREGHLGEAGGERPCVNINLDPPGGATPIGTCQYGAPLRVKVYRPALRQAVVNGLNSWAWYQKAEYSLHDSAEGLWKAYAVLEDKVGPAPAGWPGASGQQSLNSETEGKQLVKEQIPGSLGGATRTVTHYHRISAPDTIQGEVPAALVRVLGVGMIRDGLGTAGNVYSTFNFLLPQNNPAGRLGVTRNADCTWYWGEKVALYTAVGDDTDEPLGPLQLEEDINESIPEDPGVPDPGEETPTDETNPTEETGFWAVVISLLRAIVSIISQVIGAIGNLLAGLLGAIGGLLDAIMGLAGSIIGGIIGGITALFVPDSLVLDDEVDRVKVAWEETSLMKWKDSFTGGNLGNHSSSNCNGLPLDFTMPGGVDVDMNIGAACSGTTSQVAQVVKFAATGGLIVFGGLACLRAIGSGFGWNPSVGRQGDPV